MIEPGKKFDFGEMPDFGAEIKKVRVKHKLTQAQFGELVGKSATTIHSYETGKILPPFEVIVKIASLFDVTIGDLLCFKASGNIAKLREYYAYLAECRKKQK